MNFLTRVYVNTYTHQNIQTRTHKRVLTVFLFSMAIALVLLSHRIVLYAIYRWCVLCGVFVTLFTQMMYFYRFATIGSDDFVYVYVRAYTEWRQIEPNHFGIYAHVTSYCCCCPFYIRSICRWMLPIYCDGWCVRCTYDIGRRENECLCTLYCCWLRALSMLTVRFRFERQLNDKFRTVAKHECACMHECVRVYVYVWCACISGFIFNAIYSVSIPYATMSTYALIWSTRRTVM